MPPLRFHHNKNRSLRNLRRLLQTPEGEGSLPLLELQWQRLLPRSVIQRRCPVAALPAGRRCRVIKRFHIGERFFTVHAPDGTPDGTFKDYLRDWFAALPLPEDVVVEQVTHLVAVEAATTLRREAYALGAGQITHNQGVYYLSFASCGVTAKLDLRDHRWHMCGSGDEVSCDTSPESVRACLRDILLDNHRLVPYGLGAFVWGLVGVILIVLAILIYILIR